MLLSTPSSRSGSKVSIGIRSHLDWFADEGKQSVQSQAEVVHHEQPEPPHKVIQKAIDAIANAAAHRDAKEAEGMIPEMTKPRIMLQSMRFPQRFIVTLSKQTGLRLGLKFERPQNFHSEEVRITEILEDGCMMAYNVHEMDAGRFPYVVLPGMRIYRVNDCWGDAQAISNELKEAQIVDLHIRRCETSSEAPAQMAHQVKVMEKVEQECVAEATTRQADLKLGISASKEDYAGKQIGEGPLSASANERAEPSSKVKAAPEQVQSCSSIQDQAEAPTAEREYLDLVRCKPTISAHGNIEGKDAEKPLSGESPQRQGHSAEPPSRLMHEAIKAVSANPRLARPPNAEATEKMSHFEYFVNEEGEEIPQPVGSACMFGEPVHADGSWSQVPQMQTDRPPSAVSWSTGASLSRPPSSTGANSAYRYKFVSNNWEGVHSHHTGFWTPSSDSSSGTGNGSKAKRSLRNPSNPSSSSSSNPGKKSRPASATSSPFSRGAIHSATYYLQSLRPASAADTMRNRPTRAASGNLSRSSSSASVSGNGRASGGVIENAASYPQTLSRATAHATRHDRPTSAASGNQRQPFR